MARNVPLNAQYPIPKISGIDKSTKTRIHKEPNQKERQMTKEEKTILTKKELLKDKPDLQLIKEIKATEDQIKAIMSNKPSVNDEILRQRQSQ